MLRPSAPRHRRASGGAPGVMVFQDAVEHMPDVCQEFVIQADQIRAEERSARVAVVHGAPARFPVWDWSRNEVIENTFVLEGGKLPKRVAMLESHAYWTTEYVRGSATDFERVRDRVLGTLRFAEDPQSEAAWLKVRDGHVTAVSIGAMITRAAYIEPGETGVVEGVTYKAGKLPLRVNLEWEPKEVSLVVFGADPKAGVLGKHIREMGGGRTDTDAHGPARPGMPRGSAALPEKRPQGTAALPGGAGTNSTQGRGIGENAGPQGWLSAMGIGGNQRSVAMNVLKLILVQMGLIQSDADDAAVEQVRAGLSAEQAAVVDAAVLAMQSAHGGNSGGGDAQVNPPAGNPPAAAVTQGASNVVDLAAIRREGAQEEQVRQAAIREAGEDAGVEASVVQSAINEGLTVQQAQQRFLKTLRAGRTAPVAGQFNVNTGAGRAELSSEVLAAAVCQTAGLPWVDERAENHVQQSQARVLERAAQFRGMGLTHLCAEIVRQAGGTLGTFPDRREVVRQALAQDMYAAHSVSSYSLTNALSAVVNRRIMQRFQEAPNTARMLSYVTDVPDYKANTRVQLTKSATLSPAPLNTPANQMTGEDSKEQYAIARYAGQMFADEIIYVNDDIGALMRLMDEHAAAAVRLEPDFYFAQLNSNPTLGADSKALFHADHRNLWEHADSAFDAEALQAVIKKLREQYKLAGKQKVLLNVAPKYLVVPPALEFAARQVVTSAERAYTGGSEGTRNVIRDLGLEVVVEGRIGAIGVIDPLTGVSRTGLDTNWYVMGDPLTTNGFEMAFLQGTGRMPTIERATVPAGMFGTAITIKHSLGGGWMSYEGVQKSKGAA